MVFVSTEVNDVQIKALSWDGNDNKLIFTEHEAINFFKPTQKATASNHYEENALRLYNIFHEQHFFYWASCRQLFMADVSSYFGRW